MVSLHSALCALCILHSLKLVFTGNIPLLLNLLQKQSKDCYAKTHRPIFRIDIDPGIRNHKEMSSHYSKNIRKK
ncbi:hypothetical protein PCANB_000846 [Pneumocystis canis]|nr:hypothetical protein PCANB_000846 [Pneumocystis canis]